MFSRKSHALSPDLLVTANPQQTLRSQVVQTDSQQCRPVVRFPVIERLFGNVLFLSVQVGHLIVSQYFC